MTVHPRRMIVSDNTCLVEETTVMVIAERCFYSICSVLW